MAVIQSKEWRKWRSWRQARAHSIFILRMTTSTHSKYIPGIRPDVPCLSPEMEELERTDLLVTVLGNLGGPSSRSWLLPRALLLLHPVAEGRGAGESKEEDNVPLFRWPQHTHKNRSESPATSKCRCEDTLNHEVFQMRDFINGGWGSNIHIPINS